MEDLRVLIVDEKSAIESIISDCFSIGSLLGALWVNHNFLGGSWIIQLLIVILFLMMVWRRCSKKVKKMSSSDAYKYLKAKIEGGAWDQFPEGI